MNLYAISNGGSYSDHRVYVFTTYVPHSIIAALVAEINKGRRREPFQILAGAEILRPHVNEDGDAFEVFLDDLAWSAGFDEDGEQRDVVSMFPLLKSILNNYRARARKAKS